MNINLQYKVNKKLLIFFKWELCAFNCHRMLITSLNYLLCQAFYFPILPNPWSTVKILDFSNDLLFFSFYHFHAFLPACSAVRCPTDFNRAKQLMIISKWCKHHPPRTLPRSEAWAIALWEQHTALLALKWVTAASPPPTYLVSLYVLCFKGN